MSRAIFISNIPYGMTTEMEQIFEVFGEIDSITMGTSSGVIVFKSAEDAETALSLNDVDLGGFSLNVKSQSMPGEQPSTSTAPPPAPSASAAPTSQYHQEIPSEHNTATNMIAVQPTLDPNNTQLVENLRNLLKGIETNCRNRIEKYNGLAAAKHAKSASTSASSSNGHASGRHQSSSSHHQKPSSRDRDRARNYW